MGVGRPSTRILASANTTVRRIRTGYPKVSNLAYPHTVKIVKNGQNLLKFRSTQIDQKSYEWVSAEQVPRFWHPPTPRRAVYVQDIRKSPIWRIPPQHKSTKMARIDSNLDQLKLTKNLMNGCRPT